MWRRRTFIALLGIGLPATLGVVWSQRRPSSAVFAARMIALRAPYVQIDQRQQERFIADYLAAHGYRIRQALAATRVPLLYGSRGLPLVTSAQDRSVIEASERHLITQLLISSGFFDTSPPGRLPLQYSGLHPPCANRFAKRLGEL